MTATIVNGVLLAVILATWMWTWWWNRRVVQRQLDPDYEAALNVLTLELIAWQNDTGNERRVGVGGMPLFARRQMIARKVVDFANRVLDRELTGLEKLRLANEAIVEFEEAEGRNQS